MRSRSFIALIHVFFIFFSCKQFVDYNFEAETIDNSLRISGKILNVFTGKSVEGALVEFGVQSTITDEFGNYVLHFNMGTDEQRDKPVEVKISAEDYAVYTDEFVIYNENIIYNADLVYISPILGDATYFRDGLYVVIQVIVTDYQGYHDINVVNGTFNYFRDHRPDVMARSHQLEFLEAPSPTTAIYQCKILHRIEDYWYFSIRDILFYLYAEDRDGNSDYRMYN